MSAFQDKAFNRRDFLAGTAALAISLGASAEAQTPYPSRSVRFVVPSGPGSGTDIITRILAEPLMQMWGQTIVVENRNGASGFLGTHLVVKSPPDGYTLCMGFTGPLAASHAFLKNASYDPLKDLVAVTLVDSSPAVLVVNNDVPVKNVEELIAFAKANPNVLTYGSAGQGTIGHVAGELFGQHAGIEMRHIPYKNVSQAVTDVVAGHLKVLFHVAPALLPLVNAGQLRALGVTSLKRWSVTPNLPSIAEVSLPGYEATVWHGVVAPTGTPNAIITKIYNDISAVIKTEAVQKQFAAQWIEPLGSTPGEFATFLKSEVANYVKLAN